MRSAIGVYWLHLVPYLTFVAGVLFVIFAVLVVHGNGGRDRAYQAGFWGISLTMLLLVTSPADDLLVSMAIFAWWVIFYMAADVSNLRDTLKYVRDRMRQVRGGALPPNNELDWRWFHEIEWRAREALHDTLPD